MSDKMFSFLNKYYTFSKKFFPFACLGLFLILAFCKVETIVCISIYFGLMVAHLVLLGVISRVIKKYVYNTLKNEATSLEEDLDNEPQNNERKDN